MEFRTRKAHRWIVKDKDLLKYLFGMVLVMTAYLTAWTATNLNFIREGFTITAVGMTPSGEYFQTCKPLWWDYVTQAGLHNLAHPTSSPAPHPSIASSQSCWKTNSPEQG